ncbi:hypothetical protein VPH35_060984 [Triticum aestivum]
MAHGTCRLTRPSTISCVAGRTSLRAARHRIGPPVRLSYDAGLQLRPPPSPMVHDARRRPHPLASPMARGVRPSASLVANGCCCSMSRTTLQSGPATASSYTSSVFAFSMIHPLSHMICQMMTLIYRRISHI